MDPEFGIVLTTVATPDDARRLADGLLEQRLAACVQILAIQSAYRWKGAVNRDAEVLALIKTKAALYPEVEAFMRAAHPYETPEIVFLPFAAGLPAYLGWIAAETK